MRYGGGKEGRKKEKIGRKDRWIEGRMEKRNEKKDEWIDGWRLKRQENGQTHTIKLQSNYKHVDTQNEPIRQTKDGHELNHLLSNGFRQIFRRLSFSSTCWSFGCPTQV